MPYWRCFYHVVWATKHRQPIITSPLQPIIYAAIQQKTEQMRGRVLAINSVDDHIHIAVSIPPSVSIARWVGDAKGLATYAVNGNAPALETAFKWQDGYGVVTFGEKQFRHVETYIANQREHHQLGTTDARLESMDEEE